MHRGAQGKGELGDRFGPIAGHVGHRNAALSCCRYVNHVVSGSKDSNISNTGAAVQNIRIDWRLVG